jgi:hypothetical protein
MSRLAAISWDIASGWDSPANPTQVIPSSNISDSSESASKARRVFPHPPGPVKVSRRTARSRISDLISPNSTFLPINLERKTGPFKNPPLVKRLKRQPIFDYTFAN